MDLATLVERILLEYAQIPYAYEPELVQYPMVDRERGQCALMVAGWGAEGERVHCCLLHVIIWDGRVWIEHDGTEDGIATDLERAGVGRDQIVLAFHRPEVRALTGYAVA